MATTLHTISGFIYDAFNTPMAGVKVNAFDKDLRTVQPLGEAVTDKNGFYKITYGALAGRVAEFKTVDVFLRVFNQEGAVVGESDIAFNAPDKLTFDFKIDHKPYRGPAEFDRLVSRVSPLLQNQRIKITDLEENGRFKDFTFISNELGEDFEKISLLPLAYEFSNKTKIAPDIFYGLFRMDFPNELDALLQTKGDSLLQGIRTSVAENIISTRWESQAEAIVKDLNAFAASVILTSTDENSNAFKKMIGMAVPQADLQQTFLHTWFANESTPEKFWDNLAGQPGFNDGKAISELTSVLSINHLTGYQPALTEFLYGESRRDPDLKDLSGYAKFSENDWKQRIEKLVSEGKLTTFPEGIEGETEEEKTSAYAGALTSLVRALYPTRAFAERLNRDEANPFEKKADLKTFLLRNPGFDLKTNRFNKTFEDSILDGVRDKKGLKRELQAINRLYKISPQYEHVGALKRLEIHSANELVRRFSAEQLAQKLAGENISLQEAKMIHSTAVDLDKKSTALLLSYKMRYDAPVYAINGDQSIPADYQSMFGDNFLCDCEHCQSVYSPSAYFTDILNFLKKSNAEAFDELTSRRPDLVDILLTCQNTNTPLPYIDLVNELLESLVVDQITVAYQTENTAAELSAFPQNILAEAYDKLKISSAHENLPLDLPLETTRKLLDKLGLKRQDALELFFPKSAGTIYTDAEIAREALGLSAGGVDILNGTIPVAGITGDPALSSVLRESQLSYIDFLQALESYFINPLASGGLRTLQVVSASPDNPTTCNIYDLIVTGMDKPAMSRLLRFTRLRKKLNWSVFDLDRALTAFGIDTFDLAPDEFNRKILIPIAAIVRLTNTLGMTVQQACSLFSEIDTALYVDHSREDQPEIPSLYDQLFRNKVISNPPDPVFSPQAIGLSGIITDHIPAVLSALSVSPDDLGLLLEGNSGALTPVDDQLTLPNLSELYRRAVFATHLRLSIQDFYDLIAITGINPVAGANQIQNALIFIDRLHRIRDSRFNLNELGYLMLGKEKKGPVFPIIETIAGVLDPVREGLKKIADEAGAEDLTTDPLTRSAAESFVIDKLSSVYKLDHAAAKVLITDTVKFSGSPSMSFLEALLQPSFYNHTDPLFTLDELKNPVPAFPELFESYVHANKIATVAKKLKLAADELQFLTLHASKLSVDALLNNTIPVPYEAFENVISFTGLKNRWQAHVSHLMETLAIGLDNEANAKLNFMTALSAGLDANLPDLSFLLGDPADTNNKGELNFDFPADILKMKNLALLAYCIGVIQKNGWDSASFVTAVRNSDSAILMGLLKTRHNEKEWLKTISPVSNGLRVRRRDALVAYILNDPSLQAFRNDKRISDEDSLYERLLIDVEMDACMKTSRIKQAISSVQLFITRSLMRLEPGLSLNGNFSQQWNEWRKLYRIWEANRKVFLYPENWVEPELRDDKTPFFSELESLLRQKEVTDDTAREALMDYLEKLDTVGNLEIIGFFTDKNTGIVHVFGRTKALPHQYFYRFQERSVWSAWQEIERDIEGDHILPVVWNNRLMLFWATFIEKQEDKEEGIIIEPGVEMPPPPKYFEMKLSWIEYKKIKWTAKKASNERLLINFKTIGTQLFTLEQISLSSFTSNGGLFIRVFAPIRSDVPTDFIYNILGAFHFDGCNSAPRVRAVDKAVEGLKLRLVLKNKSYQLDRMFLQEGDTDPFSLFQTGPYLPYNNSIEGTELFGNTPGKVRLLPEHHEIEKTGSPSFFYGNENQKFFVRSRERLRPKRPTDVLVGNTGIVIARRDVAPHAAIRTNGFTRTGSIVAEREALLVETALPQIKVLTPFRFFINKKYQFTNFYHPYVCDLIKILNTEGIDGLYRENVQNRPETPVFTSVTYNPSGAVDLPYPVEKVDFDFTGSYAAYNWELFYHIPMLVATRLSQNQKFGDAQNWFHYIFNPTKPAAISTEGAERFWIPKPFKEEIKAGILSIEQILDEDHNPELQDQLDYWAENPFKPHAVSRLRLSAYMRSTVMKYLDNLIAWGDNLFQRDTIESINEATLLYILAGNILGKRPEKIPPRAEPAEKSFSEIMDDLDSFSNAKVEIESFISPSAQGVSSSDQSVMMPMFGIPKNDKLLSYWDTVNDRLFKIRHCMNIQGVVRQLPLFEPPIDPGLLVKAAAAGLDLNSIMNDVAVSLPHYRFQFMLQRAYDLCNDVKSLGSELLSALEKGDAEELSRLRSAQEVKLLEAMHDIRVSQRDEAEENLRSLEGMRQVIEERKNYYSALAKEFINASEKEYFDKTKKAADIEAAVSLGEAIASASYLLPEFKIGSGFTIGSTFGGQNIGDKLAAGAKALNATANFLTLQASTANIKAGYERRLADWKFEERTADLELKQADRELAAAEIRLAIAEKDLENHEMQTENSRAVDEFLRAKYTNVELYDYMSGQIASTYFQTYQMAYTLAKKAEKCMQHELGLENGTIIRFGYWDSLRKGLLSGEKLQFDLRRLENAYLEQNQREFEITKRISLSTLNAEAIVELRQAGKCIFQIPEIIFEMDFPGHYFRRIKSVDISIPCIAGPYTSVSCQLMLNRSYIRKKDENGETIFDFANPSPDFTLANIPVKAMAASQAQNDTGVFEFSFRDERYLPFEGAGVISEWNLELPSEARQFDYTTISDVIVSIRYTSREARNGTFKSSVNQKIKDAMGAAIEALNNNRALYKLVSLRNDFPDIFHQMKLDSSTSPATRELPLSSLYFPVFTRTYQLIFRDCRFFNKDGSPVAFPVSFDNTPMETIDTTWNLTVNYNPVDLKSIEDLLVLINYGLQ